MERTLGGDRLTLARRVLLGRYLARNQTKTFQPGQHDCALFAAGWVGLVTGSDPSAGFKGKYSSIKDGMALLQKQGFDSHVAVAEALLQEMPGWMAALTGDLAVIDDNDSLCFGIVGDGKIHVLHPLKGLSILALDSAKRVFRP